MIAAFGAPRLPIGIAAFPLALFIPDFYSREVGIGVGTIGVILFLARLSDVVTDPLVGHASDRTVSRWGRRKPYMAAGAPLLLLSTWMLFVPPEGAAEGHLIAWVVLIYLAYTLIDLPHGSWGAELSADYGERASLMGWREGYGMLATAVAAFMPAVTAAFGYTDVGSMLIALALAITVAAPFAFGACLFGVPEPSTPSAATKTAPFLEGLRIVIRNAPFVRLVIVVTIVLAGVGVNLTVFVWFLRDVLRLEETFAYFLPLGQVIQIASIPFWIRIADRIGKHRAVVFAFVGIAAMSVYALFIPAGHLSLVFVLIVGNGIFMGCTSGIAPSMFPDAIDLDVFRTGERRAGLYFAFVGMAVKAAIAIGVLIAAVLTEAFGFDPKLGPDNAESAKFGIRLLFLAVPAVLYMTVMPLLWRHPLTKRRQKILRAAIERRTRRPRAEPRKDRRP